MQTPRCAPTTLFVVDTICHDIGNLPMHVAGGILRLLQKLCADPENASAAFKPLPGFSKAYSWDMGRGWKARILAEPASQAFLVTHVMPSHQPFTGNFHTPTVRRPAIAFHPNAPSLAITSQVCEDIQRHEAQWAVKVLNLMVKFYANPAAGSHDHKSLYYSQDFYVIRLDGGNRGVTLKPNFPRPVELVHVGLHDSVENWIRRRKAAELAIPGTIQMYPRLARSIPTSRRGVTTRIKAAHKRLRLKDSTLWKLGIPNNLFKTVRSLRGPADLAKVRGLFPPQALHAIEGRMAERTVGAIQRDWQALHPLRLGLPSPAKEVQNPVSPRYSFEVSLASPKSESKETVQFMAKEKDTSQTEGGDLKNLKAVDLLQASSAPQPFAIEGLEGQIYLLKLPCRDLEKLAALAAECRKSTDFTVCMKLVCHTVGVCAVDKTGKALFEKTKQVGGMELELALKIFRAAAVLNGMDSKKVQAISMTLCKFS